MQGTVVLEAVISADGVPKIVRVVRSLGYGLDESAIAALERWRFNPARKDGVPVNVSLNVEINFILAGKPTTEHRSSCRYALGNVVAAARQQRPRRR